MVRLVLFDIDGTLVQTGGAGMKAFARTFAGEFGIANGGEKLKFAGRTDTSLVREVFAQNDIDPIPENFARFFTAYVGRLQTIIRQTGGRICPGVGHFMRELRELPDPPLTGLLTGNIRRGAEIKLRHFNLWEAFAVGAFADDHEERDCIAEVAKKRGSEHLGRGLKRGEVLVIGDTPLDIRCARAIEARVLAVGTGGAALEDLQQHKPDWLVSDLRGISAREICLA